MSSAKIADYAQSFVVSTEVLKASMRSSLPALANTQSLRTEDIILEPLLGGRLRRLRLSERSSALLSVKSAQEDYNLDVIVAEDMGELVIIG